MPLLFDDNKLFSIQLKDARKNMNLTQAKCAEYLNISTTFYNDLNVLRATARALIEESTSASKIS